MADAIITALTAYTTPIATDVLPIVDVTANVTKKITFSDLKTATIQSIGHGYFTHNFNSNTTTTIAHGLGRIPSLVTFFVSDESYMNVGMGSYNGTTQYYVGHRTSVDTSDTTHAIKVTEPAGDNVGTASFDATNITITWTTGTSTNHTYTISWTAQ